MLKGAKRRPERTQCAVSRARKRSGPRASAACVVGKAPEAAAGRCDQYAPQGLRKLGKVKILAERSGARRNGGITNVNFLKV